MKFTLTIESGNAALVEGGREELARMLGVVSADVTSGMASGYLRDYNGNSVGYWELETDDQGDAGDDEGWDV